LSRWLFQELATPALRLVAGGCNLPALLLDTGGHHIAPPVALQRPDPPRMPFWVGGPWCARCRGLIARCLRNIDDWAAEIAAESDGHRGGNHGDKITASKGRPSLSPPADLLDVVYGNLVTLEDEWRQVRGYPKRPHRRKTQRGGYARRLTIAFLLEELEYLLTHPSSHEQNKTLDHLRGCASVQAGRMILRWERILMDAAGEDPRPWWAAVECPRCRQRALHPLNDGYIGCGNSKCNRIMTEDECRRELAEQADARHTAQAEPQTAEQAQDVPA
jgi:hypothetical protein